MGHRSTVLNVNAGERKCPPCAPLEFRLARGEIHMDVYNALQALEGLRDTLNAALAAHAEYFYRILHGTPLFYGNLI